MLLASLLVASSLVFQGADTTLTVSQGDRLRLSLHSGSITVNTWNRSAVRVSGDMEDSDDRLDVSRSGSVITVSAHGRYGTPSEADLTVTVPAWMPLSLDAVEGDITVNGTAAAINAETVNGNVKVTGGTGNISLTSVDGSVTLSDAKGNINVQSMNDDVVVERASGPITISAVNGSVRLDQVSSSAVSAESVNGDVRFSGPVMDGGHYQLSTHNGDVVVGIQAGANAAVSVKTFQGELETDFPVSIQGSRERRISFVLGSGSARVDLESFQGTIRLVRPGRSNDK